MDVAALLAGLLCRQARRAPSRESIPVLLFRHVTDVDLCQEAADRLTIILPRLVVAEHLGLLRREVVATEAAEDKDQGLRSSLCRVLDEPVQLRRHLDRLSDTESCSRWQHGQD